MKKVFLGLIGISMVAVMGWQLAAAQDPEPGPGGQTIS